jgi:putative oxidoreductase
LTWRREATTKTACWTEFLGYLGTAVFNCLLFFYLTLKGFFMNATLELIGRLLIAALYLPAGLSKISGFDGTVGYIGSVGLPWPTGAAVLAIALEIVGSVALIVGFQTRVAAAALAVFTAVATVFFHAFWSVAPDQAFVQQLMFFKNVAVIGGLLLVVAHGAGAFSLDAKKSR